MTIITGTCHWIDLHGAYGFILATKRNTIIYNPAYIDRLFMSKEMKALLSFSFTNDLL